MTPFRSAGGNPRPEWPANRPLREVAVQVVGLTHPSPNFGPRRHGGKPSMIVLHYTGMMSARAALERLRDPEKEVSCHYLIAEDGEMFSLVSDEMRAWHAGRGSWGGCTDINSLSIGIELANHGPDDGFPPFPEPQMARLEDVLGEVMECWNIHPARVIGHSDMAPGRKIDPGPAFDWKRLAISGLSVWTVDSESRVGSGRARRSSAPRDDRWSRFKSSAAEFGYAPESDDETGWRAVLAAFRMRFRTAASDLAGQNAVDPGEADVAAITGLARDFQAKSIDPGEGGI